ncbi:helix-turn-helix transcriptional regulator [Clostridium oryzae]|uniref:Transposon Tn10 TetD protein n=1 Tax=Clostridium oryzae TaxID=1450648 RepID=A0A1V4IKE3_9CLOT|nr:AraC family transcriptional regulator [Clostridium oryzae]OPJ60339.1 transposon Tn10 TetD protein [Clostridium oryzae]
MEWSERMNEAINYIEAHIEEKINHLAVAEIACCSLSRFQRMFYFVTDVTLAEYVRCRRMSLAANDLLNSDIKIIELAQKYNYESPEAFTRAFQTFHGVPPTITRKLGIYTDYPRISFQIKINGGNFNLNMKSLVHIEEHSNDRVVSFFVNCKAPESAAGDLLRDWAINNLSDYTARRCIE